MSDTPLGAAVVGTGFGLFTHVRALRMAGFEVRAIVGRDLAKTTARAAPLSIPRCSNDLPALLAEDPAIALVTIATPPHAHAVPVLQALTAGRHVVCEKPFARDLAEARTMAQAAREAGVVALLGAEFRYDSAQADHRMLLDAVPDLEMSGRQRTAVGGEVPNPLDPPSGCTFHPRCPFANERCRRENPVLKPAGGVRRAEVACHAVEEGRLPPRTIAVAVAS